MSALLFKDYNRHDVKVDEGRPLQKSQTTQHLQRHMGIQQLEEGNHRAIERLATVKFQHPHPCEIWVSSLMSASEALCVCVCLCLCVVRSPVGSIIMVQHASPD